MKLIKNMPNKMKVICAGAVFSGILLSNSVFATENDDFEAKYTEEYRKWLELSTEEKISTSMPSTYNVELSEELVAEFTKDSVPSILSDLKIRKTNFSLDNVSATYNSSSYNLNEDIKVAIKNQWTTNECWAFSTISSLETNIGLSKKQEETARFSARHLDYATSRTFLDGTNLKGYKREVGDGGIPNVAYNYLINGEGAVLEDDMQFEDNEEKINLSEIDKKIDTIATGYEMLPSIYKQYDESGNVSYYDDSKNKYTSDELKAIRNMIKNHIINYGAISSVTAANYKEYYNNDVEISQATAYYCDNTTLKRDHAITIVGWDDNYSKKNFNGKHQPKNDGAYIVLNSYGSNIMDNGYYYISYDDVLIETSLFGVNSTSKVDYNNIYQNDFYGGVLRVGSSSQDAGLIASVYTRAQKENEVETLNNVGISNTQYASYEIYVNPNSESLESKDLIKVGTTKTLAPGYTRVDITPTKIAGEKFAIVLKQIGEQGSGFFIPIEAQIKDTAYEYVESEKGDSFISLDGTKWFELSDLNISGIDMTTADTCIKAFTTIEEVKDKEDKPDIKPDEPKEDTKEEIKISSDYYIFDEGYVTKINRCTSIDKFKNNILSNATDIYFIDSNNNNVTDAKELVKTGMKVKFKNKDDEKTYTIIVRGDLDGDGEITIVDFSKILLHISEKKGFELTGNAYKGADMNNDGDVNIVDFSKLLSIFASI